jgi:hypothetical protein
MPFDDDHPQAGTLTWPERIENYRVTLDREPYLTFVVAVTCMVVRGVVAE